MHSTYILWKEGNITHIQKFDNCSEFYPTTLSENIIFDFGYDNFDKIETEKIKPYKINKNFIIEQSDSNTREYQIKLNKKEIYKKYELFNLTTSQPDPNINYQYNSNLSLIKLDNLIQEEIKLIESKKGFKRNFNTCKN